MDINQWIESLEQANPPGKPPLSVDQPHATRKRRRGSRTSSLLEPFSNHERRDIKDRQPVVSVGSSNSDSSDATSASTSSASSAPSISSSSGKYQRRPRHRTKADKYHLKSISKSQPRKKKKKEKEKEKKPKHASRKKRKSKAVTGLVQTFQARNVPKGRLTVCSKPQRLFVTFADTAAHSLTLEPNSDCIPKGGPRSLPGVKAVRHKHSLWSFNAD
jgi:hypothetical protein